MDGTITAGTPLTLNRIDVAHHTHEFIAPNLPPVLPVEFETDPNEEPGFTGNWAGSLENWSKCV